VNYPEQKDVEKAFKEALPSADELDQERWNKLHRSIINSTWTNSGEWIQTIQTGELRLLRIIWPFTVDKMNTRSEALLRKHSEELKNQLSQLVSDRPVSLSTPEEAVNDSVTTTYTWTTQGIIGDPISAT
jgi:hypothetical protein